MSNIETTLIYGFSYRDITDIIDYDFVKTLMIEDMCSLIESCKESHVESAIEYILKEYPYTFEELFNPLALDDSMFLIGKIMDNMFPEKEFNASEEVLDFYHSYNVDNLFHVYESWYVEMEFANDMGELSDIVFGMDYKDKLIIESEGGISLHECYSDFFYEIKHLFKEELELEDFIDRMKLYSCTIEKDESKYIYPPINYKISVIE